MINLRNVTSSGRPNSWFLENVPLFLRSFFLSFIKGTLSFAVCSYDAASSIIDIECHTIIVDR